VVALNYSCCCCCCSLCKWNGRSGGAECCVYARRCHREKKKAARSATSATGKCSANCLQTCVVRPLIPRTGRTWPAKPAFRTQPAKSAAANRLQQIKAAPRINCMQSWCKLYSVRACVRACVQVRRDDNWLAKGTEALRHFSVATSANTYKL